MEVIRIPGYTEGEKVAIAEKYLVPKQRIANGLKDAELAITEGALKDAIRYYTREAGVRGLERDIAKICRKIVTEHVRDGQASTDVLVQSSWKICWESDVSTTAVPKQRTR